MFRESYERMSVKTSMMMRPENHEQPGDPISGLWGTVSVREV